MVVTQSAVCFFSIMKTNDPTLKPQFILIIQIVVLATYFVKGNNATHTSEVFSWSELHDELLLHFKPKCPARLKIMNKTGKPDTDGSPSRAFSVGYLQRDTAFISWFFIRLSLAIAQ